MKTVLFLLTILPISLFAQLDLPELSPDGFIRQKVGYTELTIRYGRPAARERKIMGELVPYGRLWRTGAGKCSTISFDQEVTINNLAVPAGAYAIVTIPGEEEWTVMLNSDTTKLYGHPDEYDSKNEVVRLTTRAEKANRFYESLTFELDIRKSDAVFYLLWENTQISFPIATGSHAKAMALIGAALKNTPRDPELLAQASYYYSANNEDPQQVLRWLDQAIANGGDRWVYHQKVDVLARLGRYQEARKAAAAGMEFLKRTKPQEWNEEVKMYEDKIASWPK